MVANIIDHRCNIIIFCLIINWSSYTTKLLVTPTRLSNARDTAGPPVASGRNGWLLAVELVLEGIAESKQKKKKNL